MRIEKRQDIINAATELFRHQGFHATGVDQVVEQARVTKATLYNHFKSKQQLIIDVINHRSEWFRDSVRVAVESGNSNDPLNLMNYFDVLHDFINDRDFTGCMFINVSGEYNNPQHPVHHVVTQHKSALENYLVEVAAMANIAEPEKLVVSLMLIFDGAVVHAQTTNTKLAVDNAKQLAETVIRSYL